MEEEIKQIEESELSDSEKTLAMTYDEVLDVLRKYDRHLCLEVRGEGQRLLRFSSRDDGTVVLTNNVGTNGAEDFILDEDVLLQCASIVGISEKFVKELDPSGMSVLIDALNYRYVDKKTDFVLLFDHDGINSLNNVVAFLNGNFHRYSLADEFESMHNNLSKLKKENLLYLEPSFDIEDGFRVSIFNTANPVSIKMDDNGTEGLMYSGAYVSMPVALKPKLSVRPAAAIGSSGCYWISSNTVSTKKGKEKTMPMSEWLAKYVEISVQQALVEIAMAESRVGDRLSTTGQNSFEYSHLIESCAKMAKIPNRNIEEFVERCNESGNLLMAAVKFMEHALEEDCFGKPAKREKLHMAPGHLIVHNAICKKCLREMEDSED